MSKTSQIRKIALELLSENSIGMRYSELQTAIRDRNPDFNKNTISGSIWDLDATFPDLVYKADRGIFRLIKFKTILNSQIDDPQIQKKNKKAEKESIKEDPYYKPFADWLVNELEECTKAMPLGGNLFKDKWGTPDVIGVRESKRSDIIPFPTEIISAEIKTDSIGLITAFGQACAYKIFSHKSYIVVPKNSPIEDIARLDALCRQFGIGLILFDATKIETPNFEIRARAIKHEPDMFYVNKNLKLIEERLYK
ncbi:MAG: hypothetical protein WCO93_00825 [bacterium]